jgi:hypothetical protein
MDTPEQGLFDKLSAPKVILPKEDTEERELHKGAPDLSKPVTLRNLFTNSNAHPIVLSFAMTRAFGEEWLGWTHETLWTEIQQTFSTQISELAKSKVRAMQALSTINMPWDKWQVFEKVVQVLNNVVPNFYLMQKPTLAQIYAAVDIMNSVRAEAFDDEVKLYMAAVVIDEDVSFVPEPLDFIQVEVSQPAYRCRDCGTEESALFHDGYCSSCTGRMDPEQGMSMKPKDELVKKGLGQNLEIVVKHPFEKVAERWDAVSSLSLTEALSKLGPSEEDVQVIKLLLAREYMNDKRKLLAEQITTLKSWLGSV